MTETTRFITVGSIQPYYRPKHLESHQATPYVPWVRMQGNWLKKAGFGIGTRMQIQVEQGRLIITNADFDAA